MSLKSVVELEKELEEAKKHEAIMENELWIESNQEKIINTKLKMSDLEKKMKDLTHNLADSDGLKVSEYNKLKNELYMKERQLNNLATDLRKLTNKKHSDYLTRVENDGLDWY